MGGKRYVDTGFEELYETANMEDKAIKDKRGRQGNNVPREISTHNVIFDTSLTGCL